MYVKNVHRQLKQEATNLEHVFAIESSNAIVTNFRPQICITSLNVHNLPQKHSVWSQPIYTSVALTPKGSFFSVPLKSLNRRRGYWKLRNAKQAICGRLHNREWYLYICREQVEASRILVNCTLYFI